MVACRGMSGADNISYRLPTTSEFLETLGPFCIGRRRGEACLPAANIRSGGGGVDHRGQMRGELGGPPCRCAAVPLYHLARYEGRQRPPVHPVCLGIIADDHEM